MFDMSHKAASQDSSGVLAAMQPWKNIDIILLYAVSKTKRRQDLGHQSDQTVKRNDAQFLVLHFGIDVVPKFTSFPKAPISLRALHFEKIESKPRFEGFEPLGPPTLVIVVPFVYSGLCVARCLQSCANRR